MGNIHVICTSRYLLKIHEAVLSGNHYVSVILLSKQTRKNIVTSYLSFYRLSYKLNNVTLIILGMKIASYVESPLKFRGRARWDYYLLRGGIKERSGIYMRVGGGGDEHDTIMTQTSCILVPHKAIRVRGATHGRARAWCITHDAYLVRPERSRWRSILGLSARNERDDEIVDAKIRDSLSFLSRFCHRQNACCEMTRKLPRLSSDISHVLSFPQLLLAWRNNDSNDTRSDSTRNCTRKIQFKRFV